MAQQVTGRVGILLGQSRDLAATQQPAQLNLPRRPADLCYHRRGHDRDDPRLEPDPVLSPDRANAPVRGNQHARVVYDPVHAD